MKRNVFYIGLICTVLILGFQNCADEDFEFNMKADSSATGQVLVHNEENRFKIEAFEVSSEILRIEKALDLIWIVDNSGSMSEEAAWVDQNITEFSNYLARTTDTRLTLISSAGGDTGVTLPKDNPNFTQFDLNVSSTGALKMLADLLTKNSSEAIEFQKKWRSGVPKALVVVSDDNSRLGLKEFKKELSDATLSEIKSFNSIIGLENSSLSPCMAEHGSVYKEFSQDTGGQVYNICEEDWSSIFTNLAIEIENRFGDPSQTRFRLTEIQVREIKAVRINGEQLEANEYMVIENKVTINKAAFSNRVAATFAIEIEYFYN